MTGSTLHARGYQPKPGERAESARSDGLPRPAPAGACRLWWTLAWRHARQGAARPLVIGQMAQSCLDARGAESGRRLDDSDPLDLRISARGWDTWDTPLTTEPRPRWAVGMGLPR